MSLFFLDTSALVKYYRREPGSDFVERLFADVGAQRLISRLATGEIESALATKVRTRKIDQETVLIARRRLESDLGRRNVFMASVGDEHFGTARRLLKRAGFPPIFVAADLRLCEVAELEGFQVANPERPALTL